MMAIQTVDPVTVKIENESKSAEISPINEGRIVLNFEYWKTTAGKLRIWQIVSGSRTSLLNCALDFFDFVFTRRLLDC